MDFTFITVAYADIFDYPLTHGELKEWMIFGDHPTKQRKKYYFLPGREHLVKIREERQAWQPKKWEIARRAARTLSRIPTIQLVGVTGGLAMNNAKREDDIDLFLVVAGGTLWISRLCSTLLMDIFRLRRHPHDTSVTNKVCLNMFVTAQGLSLGTDERDLFSAHEVLQMEPIFSRGSIYKQFLSANTWVGTFLPNAWKSREQGTGDRGQENKIDILYSIFYILFYLLEPFAKAVQLWYMQRRRTREVITDTTLRFHPKDARIWIKRKLGVRLARYNVPLDKIFYAS